MTHLDFKEPTAQRPKNIIGESYAVPTHPAILYFKKRSANDWYEGDENVSNFLSRLDSDIDELMTRGMPPETIELKILQKLYNTAKKEEWPAHDENSFDRHAWATLRAFILYKIANEEAKRLHKNTPAPHT